MDELKKLRREIDAIDKRIVALFERRLAAAEGVAKYKTAHALPVLDAGREREVLDKRVQVLRDGRNAPELRRLFELLMSASRARQREILQKTGKKADAGSPEGVVAFQGEPGANSEAALRRFFGADAKARPYPLFEDVFAAVRRGEAACGVLPIENSSTGSIAKVYDLLQEHGVSIVGEQRLKIGHVLLGTRDAAPEGVTDVYSHEQALLQCAGFLKGLGARSHPCFNTAAGAKYVAETGDPHKAAIASGYAGALYGLKVLAENVSDSTENTTRFIVISGKGYTSADANKASVRFVLEHRRGSLARVLDVFAEHNLNMVKIESRPLAGRLFEYVFCVDFEGEGIRGDMERIAAQCAGLFREYRLLGCYAADDGNE
jgi:chorismate mutase/prephenate dehydratase